MQDFSCPALLGCLDKEASILSFTGLSPTMVKLSSLVQLKWNFVTPLPNDTSVTLNPATHYVQRASAITYIMFRLLLFRSPLLKQSLLLSLPGGTKMFQFSPLALSGLYIHPEVTRHYSSRVAPFGNLRVKGCLHLTEAYRSLSRPSSPSNAKAFTMCPYLLVRYSDSKFKIRFLFSYVAIL